MQLTSNRIALLGAALGTVGALVALPMGNAASADGLGVSAGVGAAGASVHAGGLSVGAGVTSDTAASASSGRGLDADVSSDTSAAASTSHTPPASSTSDETGSASGSGGSADVEEDAAADTSAKVGRHQGTANANVAAESEAALLLTESDGTDAAVDAASATDVNTHIVRATK